MKDSSSEFEKNDSSNLDLPLPTEDRRQAKCQVALRLDDGDSI